MSRDSVDRSDQTASIGRPRSLPPAALERVLTLHAAGFGYRSISSELRTAGIDVNWSTIRRAVKGRFHTSQIELGAGAFV